MLLYGCSLHDAHIECCSGRSTCKGKDSPSLKVLFWNAGGLTLNKFIELKTVISKESPDAIGIAESGSSADNLRFFPLKGYKSYSLGRSRQIVSGIVIFVKNDLTAEPLLKHAMTSSDSLERRLMLPESPRWNLKEANWEKYASLTNTLLGNCLLDLNNDKALNEIIITILACANVCIPKGHIINGKPFWNDKLQTLKEEKDLARDLSS
ncbi:uncharacterized protein TNIN_68041 [Trichonephila inaurata madagascariensis]|uniref:Uncharacterized protein n=1 Tax=Trichonephila inaurata madagascariensis TaxID=2747483 RepID=A0A8X6JVF3_9ARAC|nr:uncharacterized protein TNIN_68041 [Trichonephila inaurata madagascariensis]